MNVPSTATIAAARATPHGGTILPVRCRLSAAGPTQSVPTRAGPAFKPVLVRFLDRPVTMRVMLILAILAAGCTVTGGSPEYALEGHEWVLVSLAGDAPLDRTRVTIEFEEGKAGGFDGCNWYGGAYRAARGTLRFDQMSSTARGCVSPPGIDDQERRYLDALGRVRKYRASEDRLVLLGEDGAPLLEFSRRVPLPMREADLVGTRWRLLSMGGARPLPGREIRMTFVSSTTIRGFAGCREFTSEYLARGDEIGVSQTTMGATECDAPDAVNNQEGQFTSDLSEASHYRLAGDRLEIHTVGGRVLVFAREE